MSTSYKFILLGVSFFLFSCEERKTISIYMGQYFEKNQKMILDIDDGEYMYERSFDSIYNSSSLLLIKNYKPINDSIRINLKIDKNDTVVILPISTKKILFGNDAKRNIFLFTEKNINAWIFD